MSQPPKNPVTRSQKAGEAEPGNGPPATSAAAPMNPNPTGETSTTSSKSKDNGAAEAAQPPKAPGKGPAAKDRSKSAKSGAVIDVDANPAQPPTLPDSIPPTLLSALGTDYIKSLGSKPVESLNKPIAVKNPLAGSATPAEIRPPTGASEECKRIGIKAIEAELAGETATANALFNLYKAMSTPKADAHLANSVRSNAFSHRVSVGGVESIPDISVLREDIAAICYAQCRKFDELGFTDNPYAKDGPRSNWDPLTGAPITGRAGAKTYSPNPNPGPGGGGGRARYEKKSGYKGSNFDPNYVDKRANNSANRDRGNSNNNGSDGPNHKKANHGTKPSGETNA
ncbi:hypothetical protein PtA15_6A838 [Puccinia triticina]|uniref:Uncharacterized protein n=1 Tax=Puccinia triticina TaxID=208348 RepID=A0ABY7CLV7_9BASI|nr:uncharacterized protein PtA15_6A838 [Puccinia triticina]WAQ86206.1 hypothetical protein PtA15_6A838 [Puccinia triticina]